MASNKDKIEVPPEVRAYMSAIASIKTPSRSNASRANAAKATAARRRDPATVLCTCGHPESVELKDHKTTCPRGRLLYQRARTTAAKSD